MFLEDGYVKVETETKADPFSLESLIAWLEKQPADRSYNWHDCKGGCLIGLYGHAADLGEAWHDMHYQMFKNGVLEIACHTPHTMGAALDRARAVLRVHG